MPKELPDYVKAFLLDTLKSSENEDEYIRNLQVKTWKKLEEYYHGIQFLFWSEIAQDWMTPDNGLQVGIMGEETREAVGPFYDYVINIYKAHGESIISALSEAIPTVEFFPDDADKADDLKASQAKNHLAIIYQKHIKAKLIFIDALLKLYNQGLVAAYRYRESDKAYGIHKIPKYKTEKKTDTETTCPNCGEVEVPQNPDINAIPTCPECGMQLSTENVESEVTSQDGFAEIPKEREKLYIGGPLNVKVPYYAVGQKMCGYLIWYIEEHYAYVRSLFPDFADQIRPDAGESRERWARTPSTYSTAWRGGSEDTNLTSIKRVWLRPWMYYGTPNDKTYQDGNATQKWLQDNCPDGIHFTVVGTNIVQWYNECMDSCWTLGKSGPSTFIHSDPLGQHIAPIQELKNQVTNMTAQTIDYGVPALFADGRIINKDLYGDQESTPGSITIVRKPAEFGQLADGFYEQDMATLSREVEVFNHRLDDEAAFVSGDQPTVSGEDFAGKTRTLGEYQESTVRSLRRLRLTYDYLSHWFSEVVDKGVNAMADDIKKFGDSEATVIKEQGQFENITVTKEDLFGNTRNLEPEISNSFPKTSEQKLSMLFHLMSLNNESINSVLYHPENSHIMTEALGFPDLYIPGEAQRYKALLTIKELLKAEPDEIGDGNDKEIIPSVLPDGTVDDEDVQIPVFKYFLSSEKGMQVKKINAPGYANCKAYQAMLQKSLENKTQNKFEKQVQQVQVGKQVRTMLNQKNVKTPG